MAQIAADLFTGDLVRLTAEEPEVVARASTRWSRNSAYQRFLDTEPAQLWSAEQFQKWAEKDIETKSIQGIGFNIRTLEDDRLIGFVAVVAIQWHHGDAWVGIGIGESDDWGKGYGTDAMRIIQRYAFSELNLHRLSLGVFSYNQRAIRSYVKAGFKHEGYNRESVNRDGKRGNDLYMGILHSEWEQLR